MKDWKEPQSDNETICAWCSDLTFFSLYWLDSRFCMLYMYYTFTILRRARAL